jgi:hypothetical protein
MSFLVDSETNGLSGQATLADLVAARKTAARLIMLMGDEGFFIVPIFQRLDREVTAAREREDVIGRVREIAADLA